MNDATPRTQPHIERRLRAAVLVAAVVAVSATLPSCGFADGEPISTRGTGAESGSSVTGTPQETTTEGDSEGTTTGDSAMTGGGSGEASTDTGTAIPCACEGSKSGERCVRFINACDETIWAGASGDAVPLGAFDAVDVLAPGECQAVAVESVSGGRAWGGRDCTADTCASSGGSGHGTLIQFNLSDEVDVYDVSLIDGFNIPMQMTPLGVDPSASPDDRCVPASCAADLNVVCAEGLVQPETGEIAYCENVCRVCNECTECNDCSMTASPACNACDAVADVCCGGQACEENTYTMLWKSLCPDAITYPGEGTSFACDQRTDFDIMFCP